MSARKIILNSDELGRLTLTNDPIGVESVKKVFTRNLEYTGIFRKQTLNLKFVGDGLNYCVDLFNLKGTEASLFVTIMVKKDYEDAWELDFQGIGKFNPFDLEFDDDLNPTLTIEFEDSGFHSKVLSRDDVEVNIGKTSSIEGVALGAMPTKDVQIAQRQIQENNVFELGENTEYYSQIEETPPGDNYILSKGGHVIPAEKTLGDTDFISTPIDYLLNTAGRICDFVTQPTGFNIQYSIAATGKSKPTFVLPAPEWIGWFIRVYNNNDPNDYTDIPLHEVDGFPSGSSTDFDESFSGTYALNLAVGQAFTIVFLVDTSTSPDQAYECVYSSIALEISLVQNFDTYITKGHYRYEFMQRIIQIITDQVDCLKSDVFGRVSLGYPVDGRWQNNAVMNGFQIRGYTDKYPVWSFKKAMKAVRGMFNVHAGVQKFGAIFKVVIEELPYFFDGHVGITLHNVTKVKRSIASEFTYSEVRTGYEKAEYEEVNGLEEYNNKSIFATYIKSDKNILDLVSPERADPYGGEFARRKNISIASTEDTQYDNDVFTYMIVEVNGILQTQLDENYDSVTNIASPETAMNLDITPQRNLLRNSDWISACVYKYREEYLTFVSADRETDLVSQRTGNTAVSEQTSIQNKDLLSSLWLNHYYHFESGISPAQIAQVEKNPYYLVKFSPFSREQTKKYFYGWIFNIQVGGADRKGTFTLLAANISSDRLTIIDPDGIYDRDPSTPLPPTDEEFGFEYSFESVFES